MFDLFPYFRNPRAHLNSPIVTSKSTRPILVANTINNLTKAQLRNMSFSEFVPAIDLPTELLTEEGINNILKFADDANLSNEKRLFLLDKLGFIGNPSMLPKLIELYYKNQETLELAHMILRDTQDIYQENKLLVNYPTEKQLLIEFYQSLLEKNISIGVEPIVIRGLIALSSNEEILINNEKLIQALDNNKKLSIDINLALKIALAFKSKELEPFYIPNIIESLQSEDKLDLDTLFAGAVVGRLTNQGLNSLQMQSKVQINQYLSNIQFKLNARLIHSPGVTKTVTTNNVVIPQAAGMWLEAKVLVNASSYHDASRYVAQYLESTSSKNHKKYIIGLSNSPYMKHAFDSEPTLIDFKKSNREFYQNTVGMPLR